MATEQDIIKNTQQDWAKSKGKCFDSRGYLYDVEANFWKPLSVPTRNSFGKGAGSELKGKMRALHSSSALAANFFDYWTDRDKAILLWALGVDGDSVRALDFEATFPTGLGGTPPHLDVAITLDTDHVVAIECKFTEPLDRSTKGKGEFKPSYFPCSDDLWAQVGLPQCQRLAEELHEKHLKFEYLDAGQLLKHALGLATQLGDKFCLYYLYYDGAGDRSEAHKREIACFADRVGTEIRFKALTYQEVFHKLKVSEQVEPGYLNYLEARYFNSHSPTKAIEYVKQ